MRAALAVLAALWLGAAVGDQLASHRWRAHYVRLQQLCARWIVRRSLENVTRSG